MNFVAFYRMALGEPNETEACDGISALAAVPGAVLGMALGMTILTNERSSTGVVASSMAGGGLFGGLLALSLVKAFCRRFGFATVAWIPLAFGGALAGLAIDVTVGQIWWSWQDHVPPGVIIAALAATGIVCTYWLRRRGTTSRISPSSETNDPGPT